MGMMDIPSMLQSEFKASIDASGDCEVCGLVAAFVAMIAFGSFGVPIKSKVAKSVDIDPLVMQTYKTAMCFITSWIIFFMRGQPFTFTPWGIVSGLFWVPSGIATIYSIKNAGMAIGMGIGSSFIVLVSFCWGIFVFGEHVHSQPQACLAVGCMLCGLVGMAYYSSPTVAHSYSRVNGTENGNDTTQSSSRPNDPDFLNPEEDEAVDLITFHVTDYIPLEEGNQSIPPIDNPEIDDSERQDGSIDSNGSVDPPSVLCCGCIKVQRRTLGIMSAVFSGVYGGSIMVPMKFAPKLQNGLGFLISFAIGATLVTIALWVLRYVYLCQVHCSFSRGYKELPPLHFRKMWLYGGSCGLIWSVGNFCSILAVENLGEGVGYSLTQTRILVSGLWGIFYFNEIEGCQTISKWCASAMVAVLGIILLSYEHHEK
jgi:glucose uptake protein GlcU